MVAAESPSAPQSLPVKPPPPLGWSHIETVNLIAVYQEKWYSVKRGQLKARQWEEVAEAVAARCGFEQPSKTATQCRHKIEKLRKRYRTERIKEIPCTWIHFEQMDQMERGPLPISVRPIPSEHQNSGTTDDEEDEYESEVPTGINNIRNLNHMLQHHHPSQRQTPPPRPPPQKNGNGEDQNLENCGVRKREGWEESLIELARAVRSFGEGYVRIEKLKLELTRETERERMLMETKRTEMILESQRGVADAIVTMICSSKKTKMSPPKS